MRRLPIFWRLSLSYLPAVALALTLLISFTGEDDREDGVNAAAWRSQSLAVGAVALTVLAAVAGLVSSERISRSLQVMRASAEHFADGDFSHRLRIPNTPEMGNLAATLNDMAAQLEDQISVVTQQRNEQEAILVSMQEGVLALDPQAHVIAMNPAAGSAPGGVSGAGPRPDGAGSDSQRRVATPAGRRHVESRADHGGDRAARR